MAQIFAYIAHKDGVADDTALELVTAAKAIDAGADVTAIVVGSGVDAVCDAVAASYKNVWKIDKADVAYPNAEIIRAMLVKILPGDAILLMAHDTFGMDLGPGLSIKMDAPFAPDVVGIDGVDGSTLKMVRQEFGGQVSTHVACDIAAGAVIMVRAGAFTANESKGAGGAVTDKTADAGDVTAKRKFLEVVEAEAGDVDITKSEVLVSIGRGIEEEDNIEIARELAEAMGADLSCSRPIVDAKWLEKSRQVGTSGQTVKPKVYMAMGISGSFQHLGGIKGNPFIVAVNKNAKAPIFQVADIGIVADILEFMPELTEKVKSA
ncbi:electron transfer flavoprotein subunit alpha/FixB family protein [Desulfosudis oleivorans]|uniref:Electron transfer flavoprotein alpha subunit n=1 Tax=Desulfosudis oleivorans (strain DSM 6200 / JCM 39069 / Hxd3) TaxID=96561 RepID=A8ZYW8_DESOH|nr:electron transfer flavoprotein subunit alpha/FixB family protein [Desulfosudis oleivorans]ABW67223.1 Electron transfer flavoprotein alpha subunit [Desulfosudis oleivorans Hxd3]